MKKHDSSSNLQEKIDEYFKKCSDNMDGVLAYMRHKKDIYDYYQCGHKIYKMLPDIRNAIELTLAIKLFGFFEDKHSKQGVSLERFLGLIDGSIYDTGDAVSTLKRELELFNSSATVKSIIRIRHTMAHINPHDKNPPSIEIKDVENAITWIKEFINKLHRLCGKSTFGYRYTSDFKCIFMDVLDVLKKA